MGLEGTNGVTDSSLCCQDQHAVSSLSLPGQDPSQK